VAEIVGPAGERGAVILVCQRRLARSIPYPAVGDGCQRAALHAPEKQVGRAAADLGEVVAEQRGEGWRAGNCPAFAVGPVLEAATVAVSAVIGPLSPRVGPGRPKVKLSPGIVGLAPLPSFVAAAEGGKLDVPAEEPDGFLGPQAAVVEDALPRSAEPRCARFPPVRDAKASARSPQSILCSQEGQRLQ
jgi:hypothetical protein